jgi:hypothetical protein
VSEVAPPPSRVSKTGVTVAVALAELLALYAVLRNGGWAYDDNLILVWARQGGLTWHWLTSLIFEHWGIAYHVVFSIQANLMPIDYQWALVLMLALLGGSIYLLQRIISLLFGWGWRAVAVAAYLGLSVLFVRPLQWWAGGLQYLPNAFFDLLCLYGYVRFEIDRSPKWVVVSAGALAGGLAFYEKPAYMLLYLALFRVLMLSGDLDPRALWQGFWRERAMWMALVAVTAAWALSFHFSGGGTGVAAGTVSLSQYLQYFRILWLQGFVPAIVDLTPPATGLNAGQVVLVVILQLALIVAVAASVRLKPSAWRAWVFLAIPLLCTGVLVARARIAQFGVGIGGDQRYLLDFAWLIPLAFCFAFSRRSCLAPSLDDSSLALSWPRYTRARVAMLLAGLAAIGYVAVGLTTAIRLQRAWAGPQARSWEQNVRRGLAKVERRGQRPMVADAPTPFVIVSDAFVPYNRLSYVLPLYDAHVRVDGALDGSLWALDSTGRVVPAAVGNAIARFTVLRGGCATAGRAGASIERRLPRTLNPPNGQYYLLLSYRSTGNDKLPLYVRHAQGYFGSPDTLISLATGSRESIAWLGPDAIRGFMLNIPAGMGVCVERLEIVTLRTAHP